MLPATFRLADLRDTGAAVERVRRLLDADCDPVAVDDAFAGDPVIGPLVRAPARACGCPATSTATSSRSAPCSASRSASPAPARSPPGSSQQHGRPLPEPVGGLTHLFPDAADARRGSTPSTLPMPRARGRALVGLCAALADGDIALDRGADRDDVRRRLLALPGIGPWTADYVAMRALGHPDVFLPTDLGVRDALPRPRRGPRRAPPSWPSGWRPWRSYAQLHLWQTRSPTPTSTRRH